MPSRRRDLSRRSRRCGARCLARLEAPSASASTSPPTATIDPRPRHRLRRRRCPCEAERPVAHGYAAPRTSSRWPSARDLAPCSRTRPRQVGPDVKRLGHLPPTPASPARHRPLPEPSYGLEAHRPPTESVPSASRRPALTYARCSARASRDRLCRVSSSAPRVRMRRADLSLTCRAPLRHRPTRAATRLSRDELPVAAGRPLERTASSSTPSGSARRPRARSASTRSSRTLSRSRPAVNWQSQQIASAVRQAAAGERAPLAAHRRPTRTCCRSCPPTTPARSARAPSLRS